MDYLARESAPFSAGMWAAIDGAVVGSAKRNLVCRRFLSLHGPLGAGAFSVAVDGPGRGEKEKDGLVRSAGRRIEELAQLFEDFTLYWRDLEEAEKAGRPAELQAASAAAKRAALKEDALILQGSRTLGTEGLLNAKGATVLEKGDWKEGEAAFRDVARGVACLTGKGMAGRLALVLGPDLYLDLHRITPNTGLLELDRVSKLVGGRIYPTSLVGEGKALLVCANPDLMDLAVGADMAVGYLEMKEFNHSLRIMETIALRIKNPEAIVVFE